MSRANWHPWLWLAIAVVLMAPLVAMQFTREIAWTGFDFLMAGLVLGGGAVLFELAWRLIRDPRLRWLASAAILVIVLAIWAEGAVGIV